MFDSWVAIGSLYLTNKFFCSGKKNEKTILNKLSNCWIIQTQTFLRENHLVVECFQLLPQKYHNPLCNHLITWKKKNYKQVDPSQLLNRINPSVKHYELSENYITQYSKTWHRFLGSFCLASFQTSYWYYVRPLLDPKVTHYYNLSAFENWKNVSAFGLNHSEQKIKSHCKMLLLHFYQNNNITHICLTILPLGMLWFHRKGSWRGCL